MSTERSALTSASTDTGYGSMDLDGPTMQAIAQRYRPLLYFHPKETHFPLSVEDIIAGSELWFEGDDVERSVRVRERGAVDDFALEHGWEVVSRVVSPDLIWRNHLHIADDILHGAEIDRLSDVPVYAHVREDCDEDGERIISILYVTMYPYNGPYRICCCCEAGAHQGDCEHMRVYVNRGTGRVVRAYFASHRMRDGEHVPAARLEMHGDRVVAYVAKGGHGLYWRPGRVYRLFCFGNDLCGRGTLWDPSRAALMDTSQAVWRYEGRWGSELRGDRIVGVTSAPMQQPWFHGEFERSRGWLKRLCCQCMR